MEPGLPDDDVSPRFSARCKSIALGSRLPKDFATIQVLFWTVSSLAITFPMDKISFTQWYIQHFIFSVHIVNSNVLQLYTITKFSN